MRALPVAVAAIVVFFAHKRRVVQRNTKAARAIRATTEAFPLTLDHTRAPAFGEALEKCVRHGMTVSQIIDMFADITPFPLSQADQVIFLQHLEVVAQVYTPDIIADIHREIAARVPDDLRTLGQ